MSKTIDQADIFTAEDGTEIELLAIRPFEMAMISDALRKKYPIPAVPTYEVETIGGGKELREHDETTVTTDEEKAAWKRYVATKTEAEGKINQEMNDYILAAGTHTHIAVDPDAPWTKIQRKFGIAIPDDPEDLRVHYLKTRVLNVDDINELLSRIMAKTGIKADMVETAKNSFRGTVRRQRRETGRLTDNQAEGQMVDGQPIHGIENGESVGADA